MTLHTCPPPIDDLENWFEEYPPDEGSFGHLLLVQKRPTSDELIDALRPYFESAHLDAREVFHDAIGIDLHPDAGAAGTEASYPAALPPTAKRGLFGEVLAGLVTEAYDLVGHHDWQVPVFLFRQHPDVEQYLFTLVRDEEQERTVFGRPGTDFVGISLNASGEVERLIAGEAKWRKMLTQTGVDGLLFGPNKKDPVTKQMQRVKEKGILFQLNKDVNPPHGLSQLRGILRDIDPEGHDTTIFSMDEILVANDPVLVPRTDLVVIVGNGAKDRGEEDCCMPFEQAPPEYTAGNDLQFVEIVTDGGVELLDGLYSSLWQTEPVDA